MPTDLVRTPSSILSLGHARCDVTPPVGIYHRMWGAAHHDKATGVHRPLYADMIVLEPAGGDPSKRVIRLQLDGIGLGATEHDDLKKAVAGAGGVDGESVTITYSHSHSAGVPHLGRKSLPGGDLIEPYLKSLEKNVRGLCEEASGSARDVTITYGVGWSDLAANRDFWDDESGIFTTGYNPEGVSDETVVVARATDDDDRTVLTILNYGGHPTTLAWENTLISPDYVGALREVVEAETGIPCVFFLGACGDLGPKDGYTGDTSIADRNGRQLGYAGLSSLQGLGPTGTDFVYAGPVVSGATLGTWSRHAFDENRKSLAQRFSTGTFTVDLPLKELPSAAELERDLESFTARQAEAYARGNELEARDMGARAERSRRWLGRVHSLPQGSDYPFRYTVWVLGDAVWVTCGGEPYNILQRELRRQFPDLVLMVSPVAGGGPVGYLLPRDRYGKGLYQEEPSCLAPGCLELLTDHIAATISRLSGTPALT
jgi:hypothetical protein